MAGGPLDTVMSVQDQGHNYSYVFNFEQDFEHSVVRVWMEENWRSVCAWASGIYMLLIFGGQSYMVNRFFYNAYFTKSETKIRSQKQVENDKILDNMKCPKIDCNIEEKQFDAIKKIQ